MFTRQGDIVSVNSGRGFGVEAFKELAKSFTKCCSSVRIVRMSLAESETRDGRKRVAERKTAPVACSLLPQSGGESLLST